MSSRTRSEFGTLGERVAATGTTQPPAGAVPGPVEPHPVEARHVWVDGAHAGLLIGWQRPGTEWLGQVVWAPAAHPQHVVVDWIPASRLRQAR